MLLNSPRARCFRFRMYSLSDRRNAWKIKFEWFATTTTTPPSVDTATSHHRLSVRLQSPITSVNSCQQCPVCYSVNSKRRTAWLQNCHVSINFFRLVLRNLREGYLQDYRRTTGNDGETTTRKPDEKRPKRRQPSFAPQVSFFLFFPCFNVNFILLTKPFSYRNHLKTSRAPCTPRHTTTTPLWAVWPRGRAENRGERADGERRRTTMATAGYADAMERRRWAQTTIDVVWALGKVFFSLSLCISFY